MELDTIVCIGAASYLQTLPDKSVNCVVTSPPYYKLRDYGVDGQIGNEQTPAEYVAKLTAIFCEVWRVLKDDGTAWLNLGDSYTGSGKGAQGKHAYVRQFTGTRTNLNDLAPKNLIGIPWRVAFALQDSGWILRSEIIWNKPNCLPESVRDRPTRAHETVFLLTKSGKYFYDAAAIAEPIAKDSIARMQRGVSDNHKNTNGAPGQTPHGLSRPRLHINKQDSVGKRTYTGFNERWDNRQECPTTRNKRSVWAVPVKALKEKHYAAFPARLIEPMILAGCPKGGVVLDPFFGSGTTGLVARRLGRHYLGCDLNPEYVAIANKRLAMPYTPQMFD